MASVIEIPCPSCEEALKVPASIFGKKIKCKHCGHAFVVKEPAAKTAKPVKPTKPGGAPAQPKKEEPKPPPPPPPEPKKPDFDDEDEGPKPNALGVIDEDDVARCPFCAQVLKPPTAVVCLHCGFNNLTRTQAESKKVWAPDFSDYMQHLQPGILALVACIALITIDVLCLLNMRDWLTDSFLQKDDKGADGEIAFLVRPGAFITLIWAATVMPIIMTGKFAVKRLLIDNKPMEKTKK